MSFRLELGMKGIKREDVVDVIEGLAAEYELVRLNAFTPTGDNAVIMFQGDQLFVLLSFMPVSRAPYARIQVRSAKRDGSDYTELCARLKDTLSQRYGRQLKIQGQVQDDDHDE